MRMKKWVYADALLAGPGVDTEGALNLIWPDRPADDEHRKYGFDVKPTKGGNKLLIPYIEMNSSKVYAKPYLDCQFSWPLLPLKEYRGGYMTATACHKVKHGWPTYVDYEHNRIERKNGGRFVRTRHRVVYADRREGRLVVDVLLRPKQ